MPESEARPKAAESQSLASDFVVRWAEYTRAYAFYPPANPRVVAAAGAMLRTLPGAVRASGGLPESGLQVLFSATGITIGAVAYDVPSGSPVRWLSERVHRAALAGAAFLPTLDEETLGAFTRRLLQHYQRVDLDQTFESLWPDAYPGIRLLDRRFDGFFDPDGASSDPRAPGGGGSAGATGMAPHHEIASALARRAAIQDRLRRLRSALDAQATDGSTEDLDVLARIVDLLPPNVSEDRDKMAGIVEAVLADLENRLGAAAAGKGPRTLVTEGLLRELVRAQGHGLIGGGTHLGASLPGGSPAGASRTGAGAGVGRAGDAAVMDSLVGLWDDMEDMPPPHTGEFSSETAESPEEQLGVYMHILVGLEEGERSANLSTHLAKLLGGGNPARLQTLKCYLETTQGSVDSGFWRLISFLRERDLELLLRTSGFLSPASVVKSFPQHFGLYLEAIDPGDATHRSELERVLTEVGPRRIRKFGAELVDKEGVLEEPRVRPLLCDASQAYLPVIRLILQHGNDGLRAEAADVLRRMHLDLLDANLLYVWNDPVGLPLEYLLTIADPQRTKKQLEALRPLISAQIVRYLRATAEAPDVEARRIYAIQHLGTYFSRDAEVLLEKIVNERRFGLVPRESKAVREAAKRALEVGRSSPHGGPSDV